MHEASPRPAAAPAAADGSKGRRAACRAARGGAAAPGTAQVPTKSPGADVAAAVSKMSPVCRVGLKPRHLVL